MTSEKGALLVYIAIDLQAAFNPQSPTVCQEHKRLCGQGAPAPPSPSVPSVASPQPAEVPKQAGEVAEIEPSHELSLVQDEWGNCPQLALTGSNQEASISSDQPVMIDMKWM